MKKLFTIFLCLIFFIPGPAAATVKTTTKSPVQQISKKLVIKSKIKAVKYSIRKAPIMTADMGGSPDGTLPTVKYEVPFTIQAPNGKWTDPIFKDACEEASIIMTYAWINGKNLSPTSASDQIRLIATWEKQTFGFHQDSSADDTYRIITDFLKFPAELKSDISTTNIIEALEDRNLVIVPINGNNFYTPSGPARHMIVIIGYDYAAKQFIAHDPMLTNGANIRVDESVLNESLRDYPSGIHQAVLKQSTAMIKIPWPWTTGPN